MALTQSIDVYRIDAKASSTADIIGRAQKFYEYVTGGYVPDEEARSTPNVVFGDFGKKE